jgi:hypothetical protein
MGGFPGRLSIRRRWTFPRRLAMVTVGALLVVVVWTAVAGALTRPTVASQPLPTFSSSGDHSLAIKSDGSLWRWNAWDYNLFRAAAGTGRSVAVRVGTDNDWVTVAAGYTYSLAIKADGSLWAWGNNDFGQLGDGTNISRSEPTRVGMANDWVCVSAPDNVTFVQTSDNGTSMWKPLPTYSLALKADGSLWAWGGNARGQLGDGTMTDRNVPTRIGTDADWVAIAARPDSYLALNGDGALWVLGGSTAGAPNLPGRLGSDSGWVAIAPAAGLKSDGSLWKLEKQSATRFGAGYDWARIADSLAVKSDGSLWAWGAYEVDYAVRPDPFKRWDQPTRVGTGTDWVAVSRVGDLSTGLKADGSLCVWGIKTYNDPYGYPPNNDCSEPVLALVGTRVPGTHSTAGAVAASTTSTTAPPAVAFTDVPASSPYYAAISAMASKAVIGGYPDGTFGPDKLVLRKHFAKMIVGAMGLTTTEADWQDASPPFTDCGPDDPNSLYPHDYIAVAKAHNLTAGKTATTFAPEANITRAQMVTMVIRAAQNSGIALTPLGADYDGTYQTYDDPNHGANVHLADANGLLAGLAVTGDPAAWMAGNATRGEVAQVLWNLMQLREK